MIDHIFIRNYKAFERENIPLDKFSLLIGSNSSGKTTVLEALDLFFNDVFNHDWVRDKEKDVVVEIHVNDERYRKTYTSPNYEINYAKCIGHMYDINHVKFLHVPKEINNAKLLNDILSINLTKKIEASELAKFVKVFDYIDGTIGNSNYPMFKSSTTYEMDIKEDIQFTIEEYTRIISNITYPYLIIGIDNVEDNFNTEALKKITQFSYQTIFTTNDTSIIDNFDHHIKALYKDDIVAEFETIRKQVNVSNKTYILVEGKYDVAWFEKGLELLDKYDQYRVIPCGGSGNIEFIKKQLDKEGIKTVVITDGDTHERTSLKRDVIELYADLNYINKRFNVDFKKMPKSKIPFFRTIKVKDDVVKKVLSTWAKKFLEKDSAFVSELNTLL